MPQGVDLSVQRGITLLCDSYLAAQPGDRVLILASQELENAESRELLASVQEKLHERVASVCVRAAGLYDEDQLAEYDLLVIASGVESVYRTEILQYLNAGHTRPRIHRIFNFSPELFRLAFTMPQSDLNALNESIIRAAQSVQRVRVTNRSGTDLTIDLVPDGGWTNSCGRFSERFPAVLPPGEVNTYSPHVTGLVIADGAVNSSFGFPCDPRLALHPVTLVIEDSRVLESGCEDLITSQVLRAFLQTDNADRVGEVGFGTNEGITEWVGFISHINERHPGLHLGLGTPSQSQVKVGWSCPLHLDVILDNCRILFGDVPVFYNNLWDRSGLSALARTDLMPDVLFVDAV